MGTVNALGGGQDSEWRFVMIVAAILWLLVLGLVGAAVVHRLVSLEDMLRGELRDIASKIQFRV